MAKSPDYHGNVEVIDGFRPKNGGDFPLMEAHDILVGTNDKRLDDLLTEILTRLVALENGVPSVSVVKLTDDGKGNITVTGATLADDGNGNVTMTANSGTLNLVDDGEGNITLEVA